MDGYTYIIEALRSDDYRRLRAYSEDGRGKFTTWLVVVARRLCLDFHRRRYGRAREVGQESRELRAARRRLVDLVTEEIDTTNPLASGSDPAMELHARTQTAAVEETVRGLPGRDRLLLALRFEEDLPAPEIARIMGYATPFHVYRRLKVVLAELRAALRRRGVDEAC
jgi:RNA polymerase sigma factor (sigma-70 family)